MSTYALLPAYRYIATAYLLVHIPVGSGCKTKARINLVANCYKNIAYTTIISRLRTDLKTFMFSDLTKHGMKA
jgi:hypothetical protein